VSLVTAVGSGQPGDWGVQVRGTARSRGSRPGPAADAVYIHLTSGRLSPGRTTLQSPAPPGTNGFIALDWKDGRLIGIEILDASTRLHRDLLDQAGING
jgi:uncharacterized protein YuzE